MANVLLLFLAIIILAGIYLYYTDSDILQNLCPNCARKTVNGDCPVCPTCTVTHPDALEVLYQLAKGCSERLRAVLRGSVVNKDSVRDFLVSGDKRVVVTTNMIPETFVKTVHSGSTELLSQIKAVVLGSATVADLKTFLVMVINKGKMSPVGAPTTDFEEAYKYMQSRVKSDVGDENLIVYIDEDIPCVEKCCGRRRNEDFHVENYCGEKRYEGLQLLNDNENLTYLYGDSMYNYYAN
jgi:hypothetical protein